jgi:chromosome segregation ATPase
MEFCLAGHAVPYFEHLFGPIIELVCIVHMSSTACVQVRSQLVAQKEEMSRLSADSIRVQAEHQRELENRERIMQDCLAAMQGEESAKLSALSQLKACKDQVHRLEQELARHSAQLDDAKERCKDLEMERDEFQVCLCDYF